MIYGFLLNNEHCFNALIWLISKSTVIDVGEKLNVALNIENNLIKEALSVNFIQINAAILIQLFSGFIEYIVINLYGSKEWEIIL
jgi:hypothetical protein